eukprot:622513-Pelagomonas_calceolata.AAC.1
MRHRAGQTLVTLVTLEQVSRGMRHRVGQTLVTFVMLEQVTRGMRHRAGQPLMTLVTLQEVSRGVTRHRAGQQLLRDAVSRCRFYEQVHHVTLVAAQSLARHL